MTQTLKVVKFAHINNVKIRFGDLTVLVGAQGSGKSLVLQWLKAAIDGGEIVQALKDAGQDIRSGNLIDLIFGVGMSPAWRSQSQVTFNGARVTPESLSKARRKAPEVFFIPAHRAMLISDGWPAPFQKLTAEVPVVARLFSQNLFDRFSAREGDKLFPVEGTLKKAYRDLIDEAVFHGGGVRLEKDQQHAKRLKLIHGRASLPFMTWTAGQREFTPLMLGLYHLLPARKLRKRKDIHWVIIEEPEMGLHPKAIAAFMLLVLDLLWRGYRVVLSTHSTLVLDVVWAMRRLSETNADWQLIADAFAVKERQALRKVGTAVLKKSFRTYLLAHRDNGLVTSEDISNLDPSSPNEEEATWGGLTGFSTRFGNAVRQAVIEADE